MNRHRYGTVTDVVPQEGRYRGYIVVSDNHGSLHYFYDAEFKNKFPELKQGDRIEIEYYSDHSRGNWYIKRIINDEVLDNDD
jgi:hypothetical protein